MPSLQRIAWASLGIAGVERAVCGGSGFDFAKDANPFVDLFFEFVFIVEVLNLHDARKVTKPCLSKGMTN
jgi:hypothetical protein